MTRLRATAPAARHSKTNKIRRMKSFRDWHRLKRRPAHLSVKKLIPPLIRAGKPGHKTMSSTNSVNTTYNNIVNSQPSTDTVSGPQQTLTQNDFLQLLVAQMENQDPLQPQSDTEMASQMAQFTSLSQTTAMSSSLSIMQANSLIGSTVTLQVPNSQSTTSGVVQSVALGAESSDGTPQIMVNGTAYDLSSVLSVTPTTTSNNQTSTTGTTG